MSDQTHEALLTAIVEGSNDAVISVDLEGRITTWNNAAGRIFGYSAVEAIGQSIAMLSVPERLDEMSPILDQIKEGTPVDHCEPILKRKDGCRIYVSLTISPLVDSQGKIIGISQIARDITERKLTEAALLRESERLARVNADLLQFAYIISHDLREPVRAVRMFTELFLRQHEGPLPDTEREWLNEIVQAATRMNVMITGLLTYSRHGNDDSPFETLEMRDVVEWAINNLPKAIASVEPKIECDLESLPRIRGNRIALIQVFANLLSNAVIYRGPAPPHIRITAERQEQYWIFAVADNGIGIGPGYLEWVFKIFRRLHRDNYSGSGIGLALCKKIIENHGGKIWVESEVGRGSTFFFSIPAGETLSS